MQIKSTFRVQGLLAICGAIVVSIGCAGCDGGAAASADGLDVRQSFLARCTIQDEHYGPINFAQGNLLEPPGVETNPSAVAACKAALEGRACPTSLAEMHELFTTGEAAACSQVTQHTRALNDICEPGVDWRCPVGAYCKAVDGIACGRCAVLPGVGEECPPHAIACSTDVVCDVNPADDGVGDPEPQICVTLPTGDGTPCGATPATSDCATGFYCDGTEPRACRPIPNTVGANCLVSSQRCGGGLTCDGVTQTCQEGSSTGLRYVQVGDPCETGGCFDVLSATMLYCGVGGTCAAGEFAHLGEACETDPTHQTPRCVGDGLEAACVDNVCVSFPSRLGAACGADSPTQGGCIGFACIGGFCVEYGQDGDACDELNPVCLNACDDATNTCYTPIPVNACAPDN